MSNSAFQVAVDEIVRDIATVLGPRRPCIEVVEPAMAQVLRAKTEWERLEIAAGMWRSARRIPQATIQQQHPEWTKAEVDREAARRMSHGLV